MPCMKCGRCCSYVAIGRAAGPMGEDAKRWYRYHGSIQNEHGMVFMPCRCEKLTDDNTCSIYEDRPESCRMLPLEDVREFQPPGCRFFEPALEEIDVRSNLRSMIGQHVKADQV